MDKHEPVAGALYGLTDLPLKDGAQKKFLGVQQGLSSFRADSIISSPLRRCLETANFYFPKNEIVTKDEAKEVDFGDWEGLTFTEINEANPAGVVSWAEDENFTFPNGESLMNFRLRVKTLSEYIFSLKENNIVLVTHGGVIRILLCQLLGLHHRHSSAFKFEQGLLTSIELFENGLGVLEKLNDQGDEEWLKSL
jgi:broad specificity phosphatase PhoE